MLRTTLILAALLAAPALAGELETVNGLNVNSFDPADTPRASVGTQLQIHGSGFGGLTGTAKPKVWTSNALLPKKRALKVVSFTDTDLVVEIKTGVPGTYDLTVQPKGKDVPALMAESIVHILAPVFDAPLPGVAAAGDQVVLPAHWGPQTFGTKKGKIKVGGKPAKVVAWLPDSVTFEMPAKLVDGFHVVELTNKIATATVFDQTPDAPYCLAMDGSALGMNGPDRFSVTLNSKKYNVVNTFLEVFGIYNTEHVDIGVLLSSGPPQRNINFSFPVDLATAEFPLVIHGDADGGVDLIDVDSFLDGTPDWSTSFEGEGANDWIVVLHSYAMNEETEGMQLHGTFSAKLHRVNPVKSPALYNASSGDFWVTVAEAE